MQYYHFFCQWSFCCVYKMKPLIPTALSDTIKYSRAHQLMCTWAFYKTQESPIVHYRQSAELVIKKVYKHKILIKKKPKQIASIWHLTDYKDNTIQIFPSETDIEFKKIAFEKPSIIVAYFDCRNQDKLQINMHIIPKQNINRFPPFFNQNMTTKFDGNNFTLGKFVERWI